jgi:hypothetical protein
MTYSYKPRFGEPVSPWVRWFAWRPVNTEDYGLQWLRYVYKRRIQKLVYLDGGYNRWWQYVRIVPVTKEGRTE